MQILLSRSPAGPGRTGKQEQEPISPNHVQAFFPSSVYIRDEMYNPFRQIDLNALNQSLTVES